MFKIKESVQDVFRWDSKEIMQVIVGNFLFALAINFFIVPYELYNSGILGLSQLFRTLIVKIGVVLPFDVAGIIAFIINIPLLIIAYKLINKSFVFRTLFCVFVQTIFLTIIPIPEYKIVDEILTSILIGGILAGIGSGLVLSSSGSNGGIDIVGIILSEKTRKLTVGNISLIFSVILYSIFGLLFGINTMIYSIIYSVFANFLVDKTYNQNICSMAIIFTKDKPKEIIEYIKNELHRDTTFWDAKGAYLFSKSYVCYVVLTKYELIRLEKALKLIDENAFLIKQDGVQIDGNFKKRLVRK